MAIAANPFDGREVVVTPGAWLPTMLPYCDDRRDKDHRGQLRPGRIPGLRWKWLVALKLHEQDELSIGQIAKVLGHARGHCCREINKTRELLSQHFAAEAEPDSVEQIRLAPVPDQPCSEPAQPAEQLPEAGRATAYTMTHLRRAILQLAPGQRERFISRTGLTHRSTGEILRLLLTGELAINEPTRLVCYFTVRGDRDDFELIATLERCDVLVNAWQVERFDTFQEFSDRQSRAA
ncbi:MAG: hypothetical protein ACYTGL_13940 [Planctomycetota bacterium]